MLLFIIFVTSYITFFITKMTKQTLIGYFGALAMSMSTIVLGSCTEEMETITSRKEMAWGDGTLVLTPIAENALRVQFVKEHKYDLPDEWLYPQQKEQKAKAMKVAIDQKKLQLRLYDANDNLLTTIAAHSLVPETVQGHDAYKAQMTLLNDSDEYLTGLGQFQDGLGNLRGVTRRLTQVNTQISIPMLLSNKGYGVLWNNYGQVDYNPCTWSFNMNPEGAIGMSETVNVTSTEGGKREVRRSNVFKAEVEIKEPGEYAILLDVGQTMARRHNLCIDNKVITDVRNLWLPPTTSVNVQLEAGIHTFSAELNNGDKPVLYMRKVDNTTTLASGVADKVDYTLFVGSADEVIATYRNLTGNSPMMPQWALGYIHCRERYHSSAEILENARTFREKNLPIDVIVQDWQWWGRYGWNSMQFDEEFYPDPLKLVNELHDDLNMRLMLSVWSKIDETSDLGKKMQEKGYYIPGTTWIDFFNQDAADEYWRNFKEKLLIHKIDAWWQDATEPENDDLVNRLVANGTLAGEQVQNVYPLLVSKTVYEGLRNDDPTRRAMILTRSGFPGIQRYGSTLWSGDVGNDWETLRRQIAGGLGLMAAGHPWWTYDAGGFFRPWGNQYEDKDYIERMLRWIEAATFLPLMRVHGYMSDTEPWRYGEQAESIIKQQLELRYKLLPYIYSAAWEVSAHGSTMMRPLLFDFANDQEALKHETEYMFGKAFLVNPVLESGISSCTTYLPETKGGWYDFRNHIFYLGGRTVTTEVTLDKIPVFVRAGSIVPMGPIKQYAAEKKNNDLEIRVYAGADADFILYEDEGDNYNCENGAFTTIKFHWDDKNNKLTISPREGKFDGMPEKRTFNIWIVRDGEAITYSEEMK